MVCVKSPPAVVPNVSVIQIGKVFHATKWNVPKKPPNTGIVPTVLPFATKDGKVSRANKWSAKTTATPTASASILRASVKTRSSAVIAALKPVRTIVRATVLATTVVVLAVKDFVV
jgi:hypothetical protein